MGAVSTTETLRTIFFFQVVLSSANGFNAEGQLYAELLTFEIQVSSQTGDGWLSVYFLSSAQEYGGDRSCRMNLLSFCLAGRSVLRKEELK